MAKHPWDATREIDPTAPKAYLTTSLTHNERSDLRQMCAKRKLSVSAYVRELIRIDLKRNGYGDE